ncbi:MAG: HEAT repeat domain-containing protein [Candidatus Eremiobacterota bacterium]
MEEKNKKEDPEKKDDNDKKDDSEKQELAKNLCNEGAEHLKQKLYDIAIMKFDRALEYDPSLSDAWHNKGLAFREAKKYDEALKAFDKALEMNPDLFRTMISKGDTLFMQGFLLEATDLFFSLAARGISPDKVEKRAEKIKLEQGIEEAVRGRSLFKEGNMEKAIEEFDISLQKNSNDRLVWVYKGKALHQLKRYEEAIACLNEAIGRFSYLEAYKEKAFTVYEQDNIEEAYLSIEAYLEANPYDESAVTLHKNCQARLMNKSASGQLTSGKLKKKEHDEQFKETVMKVISILILIVFVYLWATKSQRLVSTLKDTDSNQKKNEVIYELAGQRGDVAFDALVKSLSDQNSGVRASAVNALSIMRDKRAVEPVISMLDDKSHDVRYVSCVALGKLNDRKAVQPVTKMLKNDSSFVVRMAAAKTLGLLGDPVSVNDLSEAALNDKELSVRCSAVEGLAIIGDKNALDSLKNMAGKVKDEKLSAKITEVLQKIGAKQ